MPYAQGRVFFDADSHLMETAQWLNGYADPEVRAMLAPLDLGAAGALAERSVAKADSRRADPAARVRAEAGLMQIKGWDALGAIDRDERTRALDLLGFSRQLVFSTFAITQFWGIFKRRFDDPKILYGGARAHNRAIADFCARDPRLIAVGFVPLDIPELAEREIDQAIRLGCGAIQVPAEPAGDVSPTHPSLNGVWARLQDAGVPFMLHVGGGGMVTPPAYANNGRPRGTDFVGGGENLRARDFMATHYPPEMFLSAMILDGVLEQFPRLHGGCIELGAMWVVPWIKRLDIAQEAFARTEPALGALKMLASDYVRRQLRFTPFAHEPVGWMIENAGEELFLFSSDYPHPEGGRNPLKRFESSTANLSETAKERFYSRNFADLMGTRAALG
ncbi:MAG TPA: amidohydrolase family protein [Candidatus Binataceae bacterium]|nr:amidohydrolase family protein [Candidatus Binataceae bacterium]